MQQISWLSQTPVEKKPTPRPVPISKFSQHVESLYTKKGAMTGFEEEFNYLEAQCEHQYFLNYNSAHKPGNRGKNRYANVLPLEESRVKLPLLEGIANSDYVNANYIDGLIPSSSHAYISTQGPLETTLADFWRLVWFENVHVILMLTKLVENDRAKCFRYFPQQKTKDLLEVDGFKIQLVSKEKIENSHLVVRSLVLTETKSQETRKVTHLQYIEWPDHGLPSSTKTFRELMNLADEANQKGGPFVVHCSAGIGRTGTFCTVHSVIKKLLFDVEQFTKAPPEKDSTSRARKLSGPVIQPGFPTQSNETQKLKGGITDSTTQQNLTSHCTPTSSTTASQASNASLHSPVFASSLARPVSPVSPPMSPKPFLTSSTPANHSSTISPSVEAAAAEPCIDILSTVLHMRKQRVGMVQTREQYEFCYLVVQEFLDDENIVNKFLQLKEEKTNCSQLLS
eukprot:TRINITY_DN882_c0_g2_i2.p1 TRINITY_DN882_c0_g2~~TRINITY_DN882_c0_g2_i2.p1  ORF type:complete len:454 (-),score=62.91 TRINITY_DN882_c0_g2_i2:237-1598(-)